MPDHLLPLRHIRTLSTVAQAGGVRSSADALLRVPSSISRSVRLLEAELGITLFERKGRGMMASPATDLVLARYDRMRNEMDAVLDEAAVAAGLERLPSTATEVLHDERRLRAVSLLAEVRHMPTVGQRLGVSQPAVSAAVARMETALRCKLFLRTARGLMPTEWSARWVVRFDRVLAELRHLDNDLSTLQGRMQGLVTVGSLPQARTELLPRAIAEVRKRHPMLRIHALESPYEQLCADLISGKVDFIVGALRPAVDRSLVAEPLFDDPLGVIAASTHPLARRRSLRLSDLQDCAWVLSRPGAPLRTAVDEFFEARGLAAPRPAVETGDLALVRGLLLEAGMLTVLSTSQLRYEVAAGHLTVLPIRLPGLHRRIGITTRHGALLPPGAGAVIDAVRAAGLALHQAGSVEST